MNIFRNYIYSISKKFSHRETSEMGYRTDFEILLQGIFEKINVKRIDHNPKAKGGNKKGVQDDNIIDVSVSLSKTDIEKVYINKEQYFGNVSDVAWNFYIGGYQPAQKWLKDRKGRTLTNSDIEHYQKIIVALVETDRIMKEIDKIIG